ncbi:uncharacterized protein LOC144431919 isoform X1 [Styela clava]
MTKISQHTLPMKKTANQLCKTVVYTNDVHPKSLLHSTSFSKQRHRGQKVSSASSFTPSVVSRGAPGPASNITLLHGNGRPKHTSRSFFSTPPSFSNSEHFDKKSPIPRKKLPRSSSSVKNVQSYLIYKQSGGVFSENKLSIQSLVCAMNDMGSFNPNSHADWVKLANVIWNTKFAKGELKNYIRKLRHFWNKNSKNLKGNETSISDTSGDEGFKNTKRDEPSSDFSPETKIINSTAKICHKKNTPPTPPKTLEESCENIFDQVSKNSEIFLDAHGSDFHVGAQSSVQAHGIWKRENPTKNATFKMDTKNWNSLFNSVAGRKIKNPNWADVFRKFIKESDPYCSYAFRWHTVNSGILANRIFACSGHCCFTGCSRKISVVSYRKDPRMFHISYTDKIRHIGLKSMRLKGKRRKEFQEKLVHVLPRKIYLKKIGALSSEVFHSGNRDDAPSQAVLKKARHESRVIRVPNPGNQWDSLYSLRKLQYERSKNQVIRGTLQQISRVPSGIMFWSEASVKKFIQNSSIDIIYIDATGGILASGGHSPYYVYEIVTRHPQKGKSPLAVATFVTNRHNIPNISNFLMQFR